MKAFSIVKEHAPTGASRFGRRDSLTLSDSESPRGPSPHREERSEEWFGRRDSNPRYLGQNQASWPLNDSRSVRAGARIYAI